MGLALRVDSRIVREAACMAKRTEKQAGRTEYVSSMSEENPPESADVPDRSLSYFASAFNASRSSR